MSPVSVRLDRDDKTIKLDKYMTAGVREHCLVDSKKKNIVVYTEDGEEDYNILLYTFDNECKVDFKEIYDYIEFMYEKE